MKKLAALFMFVLLTSGAFAQGWTFDGYFPDTTSLRFGSGGHGIACDPYGRVWIHLYSSAVDSIWNGNAWVKTGALYCFNPDGTQASFSPIKVFVGPTFTDSLVGNTGRGLKLHTDGDILATHFDFVQKVDYKTGLSKGVMRNVLGASGVAAASDANGNIFTANVVGGNPIKIWDPTFNFLGNAVDSSVGFSRSFEVGADGNTIYWAGYTNHAVLKYTRPDEFSPFTVTDTVFKGFDSESMAWNRKYNRLWASAGSNNDLPNRYPGATTFWTSRAWYAMNTETGEITDSLIWNTYPGTADARPRGIAFSPSGDTAYVIAFGASNYPPVERFINPNPSSIKDLGMVADDFKLFQNYPNPFNPSTEIKFSLKSAGFTTLKVYDILGKEVATLVSENLGSGVYAYSFDASKLASGTYIYEVVSNNVRLTNKMLLMK
ncbi:MAG: T9SS type A sorting domain-containing protein [Ignavibacteriales bacterium]|nr:T9SS type A sorting domain-containing protein [Ignavibacteriales bacterium]